MSEIVRRTYEPGSKLVSAGEPGDSALLITEGRVAIAVNGGPAQALLGPGMTIGELAVVLGVPYDYSASAIERVTAIVIPRPLLVEAAMAAADSARPLARCLITELAPALRSLMLVAPEAPPAVPTLSWQRMILTGDAPGVAPHLPAAGLAITRLPFRVGRGARRGGREGASDAAELLLPDTKPYKLSRHHFTIDSGDEGPVVRDSTSSLGTVVNGARIGAKEGRALAPLRQGHNSILAGTESSPFRFTLIVEAPAA